MKSLFKWYSSGLLNPRYRWWILLGTLIYILSPIDLSPDLLPFAGQIDDVVLIAMLVSGLSQLLAATQLPADTDSEKDSTDSTHPDTKVTTIIMVVVRESIRKPTSNL